MAEFPNVTTPSLTEETSISSESFLMTTTTRLNSTGLDLYLTTLDPRDPGENVWAKIKWMHRIVEQFILLPLVSFGLVGNALSLWVWSADKVYNSTVFMLKMLAMWDSTFCLTHILAIISKRHLAQFFRQLFIYILTVIVIISQICSVYTTLLSSLTRLLAIFRPAQFNTILSRPRVIALCVAIFFWSLFLSSFETSMYVCFLIHGKSDCRHIWKIVDFYRKNYIYDLLAFCIPIFLLLACNVLTVWKFSSHRNDVSAASSNQGHGDKTRRLSITMVTISVTSLLSYPVAVSVRLGLNPGQDENGVCDLICYYIVAYFCGTLVIINSCINVVYYFVISSRFREFWSLKVKRLFRFCHKKK